MTTRTDCRRSPVAGPRAAVRSVLLQGGRHYLTGVFTDYRYVYPASGRIRIPVEIIDATEVVSSQERLSYRSS